MDGFGERLRKLRKSANVTQSALADYLGIVPSAVGKYELYSKSYPSIEALIKISDFFNVSTDYLLKGLETPSSSVNNSINNGLLAQANNGNVVVNSKSLSPEAAELVKIYENLKGRDRLKLLNFAIEMEERAEENGNGKAV